MFRRKKEAGFSETLLSVSYKNDNNNHDNGLWSWSSCHLIDNNYDENDNATCLRLVGGLEKLKETP